MAEARKARARAQDCVPGPFHCDLCIQLTGQMLIIIARLVCSECATRVRLSGSLELADDGVHAELLSRAENGHLGPIARVLELTRNLGELGMSARGVDDFRAGIGAHSHAERGAQRVGRGGQLATASGCAGPVPALGDSQSIQTAQSIHG
jgi:hypothetical protein